MGGAASEAADRDTVGFTSCGDTLTPVPTVGDDIGGGVSAADEAFEDSPFSGAFADEAEPLSELTGSASG
jgi:hypothetical protein